MAKSSVLSTCSSFFGRFPEAFSQLLSEARAQEIFALHGPRGGGSPKLSGWQWLMGRVYHAMAGAGSFAAHMKEVTHVKITGSALSQRGRSIGWELMASVLHEVLRPLAAPQDNPEAFYGGLRLLAIDGTRMNLPNTPANQEAKKVPCSKGGGQPAFAQLLSVVLAELGVHQPLAAAFGWQGEGETTLARRMFEHYRLPEKSLVLGDRLFGSPWLVWGLLPKVEESGGAFLLRVKENIKTEVIQELADGSKLVKVPVVDPAAKQKVGTLIVREIWATIYTGTKSKPKVIRLWSTLLDAGLYPAQELVELYATRWEHELFFRELKSVLHCGGNLLEAQSPESAVQEMLAMLMAAALLASQRIAVALSAETEVLRISFGQVLRHTAALCQGLEIAGDLLTPAQRAEWIRRTLSLLAEIAVIPKRKPRSCQRALRQPVKPWPKMRKPTSLSLIRTIIISNP